MLEELDVGGLRVRVRVVAPGRRWFCSTVIRGACMDGVAAGTWSASTAAREQERAMGPDDKLSKANLKQAGEKVKDAFKD